MELEDQLHAVWNATRTAASELQIKSIVGVELTEGVKVGRMLLSLWIV